MLKTECEQRILEKLKEIDEIHREFNPNPKIMVLAITEDGYSFNNIDSEYDEEYDIVFHEDKEGRKWGI